MSFERAIEFVFLWLCVQQLHGTLVLGAALLIPVRSRIAEIALRVAVIVPVVTAAIVAIRALTAHAARVTVSVAANGVPSVLTHDATPGLIPVRPGAWSWMLAGVAAWLTLAAVRALVAVRAARRARRVLARRRPLDDPRWRATWSQIRHELGPGSGRVGLSANDRLASPVVTTDEICIPRWMIDALDASSRRAVLVHEAAHLIRRDPAWRRFDVVFETLLWTQPLVGIACRRLRELAEFACDDRARREVGSGRPLAIALEAVARRAHDAHEPLSAVGLSGEGTTVERVRRLLMPPSERTGRVALPISCLVAAILLAAALPAPLAIVRGAALRDAASHVESRLVSSADGVHRRMVTVTTTAPGR